SPVLWLRPVVSVSNAMRRIFAECSMLPLPKKRKSVIIYLFVGNYVCLERYLSTNLRAGKQSDIVTLMWILVWICACVLAWQGSTIAGGTRNAEVKNLALT